MQKMQCVAGTAISLMVSVYDVRSPRVIEEEAEEETDLMVFTLISHPNFTSNTYFYQSQLLMIYNSWYTFLIRIFYLLTFMMI